MKKFQQIWLISLILKILLAIFLPMTPDESYYWVWAQRLQLSYFDHPPFIAWLFKISSLFLPHWNSLSRLPAVILGHCTLLVWYKIWVYFKDQKDAEIEENLFAKFILVFLLSPMIGVGSLIATPDVPVVFFWSLATLYSLKILESHQAKDYALLGMALGLGFCAKYHIVLFVPILFIYLIAEKKISQIRWQYVLITVAIGLLFSSPVILWNIQNDFSSFRFQLKHGLGRPTYKFYWTWTYVLAQTAVLFPTVIYLAVNKRNKIKERLLAYLGWGPIIFFFASSFKGLVEVNWPIVAYPSIVTLALLKNPRSKLWPVTNFIWALLISLVLLQVFSPWKPLSKQTATDKANELIEFSVIEPYISKYQPFYASTYQMASWLWHQTNTPIFKLHKMSRKDLFDDFPEGMPQSYPIFVAMKDQTALPEWIENDMSHYQITMIEKLEHNFVIIKIEQVTK